jgi:hypothetical protein
LITAAVTFHVLRIPTYQSIKDPRKQAGSADSPPDKSENSGGGNL